MAPRTLATKLGLKAGMRAYTVNAPSHYHELIADAPVIPKAEAISEADFVHLFCDRQGHLLMLLEAAIPTLASSGMLWISWPKKISGVRTDLSMGVVQRIGLLMGLVDVKICAVDEVWSGLKFVYRVRDRGKTPKATGTGSHSRTP